jgi:3-oxoacyl-[acyl-carrier protein] reductase
MDLMIAGKVALVCGAGSGLGQAIALALANEGVRVALTGRNEEKLAQTVQLIEQAGGQAQAWKMDLSQPECFDETLKSIRQTFGAIGILINNSGGPAPSTASGVDPAIWQQQFTSMVGSLIQLTDKVLPDMLEAGWGRIIISSSSGVITPIANLGVSNTLRMALLGWSKTLATEVASRGITVNMLVPGRIATDRVAQLDAARAVREGVSVEEVRTKSRASIPTGRYGHPNEYGAAAAFLASQGASFITGSVLRVDGGMIPSI